MWATLCFVLLFASAFASHNETCIVDPTQELCKNYEIPDDMVNEDISSLCGMMPEMPGCTIDTICGNSKYENSEYCVLFSIYGDLCNDMPMMSGCADYVSMCKTQNSTVEQCKTPTLPLPSTMDIEDLITSICNDMGMDGCNECTSNFGSCDLLTTYSDMCKQMPNMDQCDSWKEYCEDIPTWPLCENSGSDSVPIMRMYFHTGLVDYVLFKDWVPRTSGQYAGTWIAVCLTGIILELVKLFRHICEKEWNKYKAVSNVKFVPFDWRVDVPRAAFRFVEVILSYALMLVAMTFNVGLFFAVCVGLSLGTLLFGRFTAYEKQHESDTECCN